jgi:cytosine/uracil/thiamine/allantoin permease
MHTGFVALAGDKAAAGKLTRFPDVLATLYSHAWFARFGTAFLAYLVLLVVVRRRPKLAMIGGHNSGRMIDMTH